jgi:ribosome biogenesis protein MAK21
MTSWHQQKSSLQGSQLFSASPGLRTLIDKVPVPEVEGTEYEPYKREPQYAHAQSSALWELVCFFILVVPTIIVGAYL